MYDYNELLKSWRKTKKSFEDIGVVTEFIKMKPAKEHAIRRLERKLHYTLPSEFRETLLQFSCKASVSWDLTDSLYQDSPNQVLNGNLGWNFSELERLNKTDNIAGFLDLFIFNAQPNHDFLGIDLTVSTQPVVYWDHDKSNLVYIASSFLEYLEMMSEIHGAGNCTDEMLGFFEPNARRLDYAKSDEWEVWLKNTKKKHNEYIKKRILETTTSSEL